MPLRPQGSSSLAGTPCLSPSGGSPGQYLGSGGQLSSGNSGCRYCSMDFKTASNLGSARSSPIGCPPSNSSSTQTTAEVRRCQRGPCPQAARGKGPDPVGDPQERPRSEPGHPSLQHYSGPRPTRGLGSHQASAQGHVPTVGLGLGLLPELLDPGQQAGEVGGAHGHPSHLAGACRDRGTSPHWASQTALQAESTADGALCTTRLDGGWQAMGKALGPSPGVSTRTPLEGGQPERLGRKADRNSASATCQGCSADTVRGQQGAGGRSPGRGQVAGTTPVDVQERGQALGAPGSSQGSWDRANGSLSVVVNEWAGGMKC